MIPMFLANLSLLSSVGFWLFVGAVLVLVLLFGSAIRAPQMSSSQNLDDHLERFRGWLIHEAESVESTANKDCQDWILQSLVLMRQLSPEELARFGTLKNVLVALAETLPPGVSCLKVYHSVDLGKLVSALDDTSYPLQSLLHGHPVQRDRKPWAQSSFTLGFVSEAGDYL